MRCKFSWRCVLLNQSHFALFVTLGAHMIGINGVYIYFFSFFDSCRFGRGEIHNIASFIGGVASQEVIKLITHQYIPMDNTFVFDGARSVSAVFAV